MVWPGSVSSVQPRCCVPYYPIRNKIWFFGGGRLFGVACPKPLAIKTTQESLRALVVTHGGGRFVLVLVVFWGGFGAFPLVACARVIRGIASSACNVGLQAWGVGGVLRTRRSALLSIVLGLGEVFLVADLQAGSLPHEERGALFDALVFLEGGFEGGAGFALEAGAELGLGVGGGDAFGFVPTDELERVAVEQEAVHVLLGADGVTHLIERGEDVLEGFGRERT